MKSTDKQLRKRGFLSVEEYNRIVEKNLDIIECLNCAEAMYRTFVYRKLKEKPAKEYLILLCDKLKEENALYSRIELCECIVAYGIEAMMYLAPLIGTIGENQHRQIGNYDLKKKSYPLPRDIVARIMIRMGPDILKYYNNHLIEYENSQLSEIIDVIGHISYTTGNQMMAEDLINEYMRTDDDLIKWKIIKSFQSFDNDIITGILYEEMKNPNQIIVEEAKRSLERIIGRTNK